MTNWLPRFPASHTSVSARLPKSSSALAASFAVGLLSLGTPLVVSAASGSGSDSKPAARADATLAKDADAAAEVDAALAKLVGATYRKREQTFGMAAMGGNSLAMVTEVSGDQSHLVVEMEFPKIGRMRQEQIKVGDRTAVRASAPALVAKIKAMKHDLTMSSVKNILGQITQIAMALQTGGLSTAQLIMQGVQAAANARSTAEAQAALTRVIDSFDTWTVIKPDAELDAEDAAAMAEAGYSMPPAGASPSSMMKVEKKLSADGKTAQFTRRPAMAMPAGSDFHSIVYVDTSTGRPTAEENFINGQRLMRTEYFDFGAPIAIEIPDCLK
jgi:hypothetical protein